MKGKRIILYTDGSCYAGHPEKLGGYGWRWELWDDEGGEDTLLHFQEGNWGYSNTTISRMEMRAVLYGIRSIECREPIPVYVVSDSQFVINFLNKIKEKSFNDLCVENENKNIDLYRSLFSYIRQRSKLRKFIFIHVRGHGKETKHQWALQGNKRADELADYKQFNYYEKDLVFTD